MEAISAAEDVTGVLLLMCCNTVSKRIVMNTVTTLMRKSQISLQRFHFYGF